MTQPRRAIGYARVSVIVDDSTSIARQRADIEATAAAEGVDLVDILIDEGKSGRKARAKADEAIRQLRDAEVDVLIVWKFDRLTRGGIGALVPLFDALDAREAALKTGGSPALFVTTDGLRSDGAAWRILAVILAELARSEVENTAARAASAMHYRRTVTHRFTGGGTIPYGYASIPAPDGVGRVLVEAPKEAAIVREFADHILNGWTARRVARELNARGVPTSKSEARKLARSGADVPLDADRGTWRTTTVTQLWSSHSLLGRQAHRGELVRGDDGLPLALWPPLLPLDVHTRLVAALRTPVPEARPRRAARLLSGVAYCHCGAKLYVTSSGGVPMYGCGATWNADTDKAARSCPSPKIAAHRIEDYVTEAVLKVTGNLPEVREQTVSANPHASAELAEVEAHLSELQAALLEDDDEDGTLYARFRSLKRTRDELRDEAGKVTVGLYPTGRTIREAWEADEDPDARRPLIELALDHVELYPAVNKRGPVSERVALRWHVHEDEVRPASPALAD